MAENRLHFFSRINGRVFLLMLWTAEAIDQFIAADKTLVGDSGWVCDPNEDQCRLTYTIAVEGVPTGSRLEVIDYPISRPRGFSVTLNLPPCVWRLDYDPTPGRFHTNDVPEFHECSQQVDGRHYHPWQLNRRFHTGRRPPDELPLALELNEGIKSFESALHWFCGQVNITFGRNQLPSLPPAGRLL